MSEPVTQAEIEDVLSSIRRLVSEDARDAQAKKNSAAPDATPDAPEEVVLGQAAPRLVLTPALRVLETSSAGAETEAAKDEASAFDAADMPGMTGAVEGSWDHSAASPESITGDEPVYEEPSEAGLDAVDDLEQIAESDLEDEPWKDPWATLYQAAGVAGDDADVSAPADGTEVPEPVWQASERVSAVVQKITELEAKVAQSKQQWEPDGRSSDPYSGSNIETLQWQDHVDAAADDLSYGSDDPYHVAPDAFDQDIPMDRADPDAPQSFGTTQSCAGVADEDDEDREAARKLAEEAVTAETLEALAGEDGFIDEDSLREMVADIVREELQGALGERITRNVRKLVRREIHRALAAQDLL